MEGVQIRRAGEPDAGAITASVGYRSRLYWRGFVGRFGYCVQNLYGDFGVKRFLVRLAIVIG